MLYQTYLELEACKNEEPQEFKRNVGTMFQNPNWREITIRLFTIRGNVKLKVDELCKKVRRKAILFCCDKILLRVKQNGRTRAPVNYRERERDAN